VRSRRQAILLLVPCLLVLFLLFALPQVLMLVASLGRRSLGVNITWHNNEKRQGGSKRYSEHEFLSLGNGLGAEHRGPEFCDTVRSLTWSGVLSTCPTATTFTG